MEAAIVKYNKTRMPKLVIPDKAKHDEGLLRQFVFNYIEFRDPAGSGAKVAGMPGVPEEGNSSDDDLPTTAPVAPYNDVRNDPYFVMR